MKRAAPKKPAKAKAAGRKRKPQPNSLMSVLENMDEGMLAMLREAMLEGLSGGSADDLQEDPVELFRRFLQLRGQPESDEELGDLAEGLVEALDEVRVSSNGGSRAAREAMQAIYDLLDEAIERDALDPVDLMMMGKILADAEWAVPETLKQALTEAAGEAAPGNPDEVIARVVSSLLELAEQTDHDPFVLYTHVSSLLAVCPPEASALLMFQLADAKQSLIVQTVAGFVLHPDPVLAQAAAEALASSAKSAPAESVLIERLVRMRPWLPQPRQAQLDAAIRALRANALPPVKIESPKLIKCWLSICDGVGTRNFVATQRVGTRYQLATVMMKPNGVHDAMVLRDVPKSELDDLIRQLKSDLPLTETDLAGLTRTLELAIAENIATGSLPPFKLIEVVESLGLGPIHPNAAAPLEIIEGLLADQPPEETGKVATAKAHGDAILADLKFRWFEAGEQLEDLLYPIKGLKPRVAKLLTDFLPQRRQFWARQCALSALAMRGDPKAGRNSWRQLALIGRDIASDVPFSQIPLMRQVADSSVRAFEARD